MPAWWNSLEAVNDVTWWLRWIGAGLTIVGGLCVIATLATSKRAETLKEKRSANRHLTPTQNEQLSALLMSRPKGTVVVRCVSGVSPEPCAFAEQLAKAFVSGGWTVTAVEGNLYTFTVTGLHLVGHDNDLSRLRGNALAEAVSSFGFPVKVRFDPFWIESEPEIVFTVGLRSIE